MKLLAFIACIFTITVTAQDFDCRPVKFHGPFKSNHAKLQISSPDADVVGNLTASTGNQRISTQTSNGGTVFLINSCISDTISAYRAHEQSCIKNESWIKDQCTYSQYDYVQVINPATGHCLIRNVPDDYSNVTFTPCAAPDSDSDFARLFRLVQTVTYYPNWTATPQYNPAYLEVNGFSVDGIPWAWSLAADRRTAGIGIAGSEDYGGATAADAFLIPS